MSDNVPRWYQEEAINSVVFGWEEYDKVLLHSATGSGKNFMAAHIIAYMQPKRCLFLGDQNELVFQPAEAINRFGGIIPAIEKAKDRASLNARVIVASVQTLSRQSRLENYPPDFFDCILVDECHRQVKQKQKIIDYFSKAKVCGLTATPYRSNLKDLSKWYEKVVFSMPMLDYTGKGIDLIGQGFAPRMRTLTLPVEIDLGGVETKRGFDGSDYDASSLSTTIAPYYEEVIRQVLEHAPNRHYIVFLPLIESSKSFAAIARAAGISAVHIDGKSEDREEILERFRRGQYQMLCNANVVETGVDIPLADCYINLRPTRSMVRYFQGVGRVLRVLPGVIDDLPGKHQAEERKARIAASAKPDALILDFLWQHDEFLTMRPGCLVGATPEDARAIFERTKGERTPEDLQRIAMLVLADREAAVVKRLEKVAAQKNKKLIDPLLFGRLIQSRTIQDYRPSAQWESDPPSEKQKSALHRFGIDPAKVESKGIAGVLMDACVFRFRYKLAVPSQLIQLHEAGVTFNGSVLSMRDAKNMIARAKVTRTRIFDSIEDCCTCSHPNSSPPCRYCESGKGDPDKEEDEDLIPF